jgi:hydroxyacyl-ACP dehydratase HTD2-like protein with hotdog domain
VQGTPLPPGYHLAYFTPAQLPSVLGRDGTDASFNPDHPFTRRMWAGGSLSWAGADPSLVNSTSSQRPGLLRVGNTATEITKVLSCEPKTIGKTGEPMLVVGVEKQFLNDRDELCVIDKRNWVFRKALDPDTPSKPVPKKPERSQAELDESVKGKLWRGFKRDEATLFRFSALTFNAHRIHYDLPWASDVEGHRGVVVHGPMNLLAMLDFWRDELGNARRKDGGDVEEMYYPESIEYRATSPVYAGEGYRVMMDDGGLEERGGEKKVEVVSCDGTVCMKGTIIDWGS